MDFVIIEGMAFTIDLAIEGISFTIDLVAS